MYSEGPKRKEVGTYWEMGEFEDLVDISASFGGNTGVIFSYISDVIYSSSLPQTIDVADVGDFGVN